MIPKWAPLSRRFDTHGTNDLARRSLVGSLVRVMKSGVVVVGGGGGDADNLRHDKAQKGDDNKYEEEGEEED